MLYVMYDLQTGCTALSIASHASQPHIVEFLLHNGANPNIQENVGSVLLHGFTSNNSIHLVIAGLWHVPFINCY